MNRIPQSLGVGPLLASLFLCSVASANKATIIGVYENCQPISSTIIVSERTEQSDGIVAQAEAAGIGLSFDQALPRMIAVLETNGVKDISVQRRGVCETGNQGQFVEAVVGYCDEQIARAEIMVDGNLFFSRSGTGIDLDTFLGEARDKLRTVGIISDPRVSLSSNVDCGPSSPDQSNPDQSNADHSGSTQDN